MSVLGSNAGGGAIYNFTADTPSTTRVSGSAFANNLAIGGAEATPGDGGGFGLGGAIINFINGPATASPSARRAGQAGSASGLG